MINKTIKSILTLLISLPFFIHSSELIIGEQIKRNSIAISEQRNFTSIFCTMLEGKNNLLKKEISIPKAKLPIPPKKPASPLPLKPFSDDLNDSEAELPLIHQPERRPWGKDFRRKLNLDTHDATYFAAKPLPRTPPPIIR